MFSGKNPDVQIGLTGPGTGDGLKQFCGGGGDVADASRAIKDEEKAICDEAGITFTEFKIGIDGISLITKK